MGRAGLWLRWSWRDLRERWLLVGAIAFVIAIGTGLAAGLGSIERWRVRSLDRSTELLASHDLRLSLAEGSFASRGQLLSAAETIPHAAWVEAAEERLVAESQLDASSGSRTVLTPGRIVGVDVSGGGPDVDRIDVEAGRALAASDDGRAVGILEASYANTHELAPNIPIQVAGGKRLLIAGFGRSPETFFIVPPGTALSTPGSYGIVFVPLATAQELTGRPAAVNELVLVLTPKADAAVVESELEQAMRSTLPQLGATITRASDEDIQRVYEDAGNDQQLMNVLALFVLVGAALAAFNLVGRVIEAQRRQIGIGMALGTPPLRLAVRPLLFSAEVALLGVVFGIGVGVLIGWAYSFALREFFPLPVIETPLEPSVFLRAAAVGFVLPFAATAYPVWRGVRMRPIEAIEIGFRAGKGSGLAPLLRRIPLPGGTFAEMPIRDTVRTPRRTLMTVIGLAAVVAVVVAFFGMIDSFGATIDRTQSEALRGSPSRMSVELDGFYARSGPEVSEIVASPAVAKAEATLRLPSALVAGDNEVDVFVELVDPGSELWQPSTSEGSFTAGTSGILITEKAASDLGVGVGDELTLRHPRRTGPTAFEMVETTLEVVGLDPNPLRFYAYMDEGQGRLMNLDGMTNALSVTPAAGVSQDETTRALFGMPGVASVEAVTAASDALEDYIQDFNVILQVAAFVVMLLALLMAFNSTSINADERMREHATMFAFGLPVRSVLAMSIAESLIKGILATLLGIVVGLALIGWVFYAFLPEVLPEVGGTISLSSATYAAAVLVGVVASALAPLLTVRRLRRLDVPSALRVIE
jgi:putative ABC transport system permease protein